MPTECSADLFGFAPVEGRRVEAGFDGGTITLGCRSGCCWERPTGRSGWSIGLPQCFRDVRRAELVEHEVSTLVGQRVFGLALGYEDLNDHDRSAA